MRNCLRILVGLVAVLITVGEAQAQLDNSAFVGSRPGRKLDTLLIGRAGEMPVGFRDSISRINERRLLDLYPVPAEAGELRLALNAFTFFKNNEYFNKIIEGYTLFGTQVNPQLVYYPAEGLRLEAGVFLWKDFGNPALQLVRPTYRATWTVNKHQFVLGNTRPHLHHGYIEPLFNFERVMLQPLEEGLQYRFLGERLFLDAWVDWQRQQYRFSNFQEELVGGLSSRYRIAGPGSKWQVAVPFQFTATHKGGQIDTLDRPLQTLFNAATGLDVQRNLGGSRLRAVRFNGYILGFRDRSFTSALPFRNGTAFYLNGTLETKYADVMLSYFEGQRFIAPLGGDLYQGLSRSVSEPTYTEANRRLLLVRLLRDFRISDAAALTVRVEPVYDFNAQLLDFSFGVYLNFRQEWLLGNVARRARAGQ